MSGSFLIYSDPASLRIHHIIKVTTKITPDINIIKHAIGGISERIKTDTKPTLSLDLFSKEIIPKEHITIIMSVQIKLQVIKLILIYFSVVFINNVFLQTQINNNNLSYYVYISEVND